MAVSRLRIADWGLRIVQCVGTFNPQSAIRNPQFSPLWSTIMRRLTFALLVALPATAPAQSLLYRTPNLGGTWTGEAGVVHFNFLHRFYVAPSSGGNKVTNFPSFLIGVGIAD